MKLIISAIIVLSTTAHGITLSDWKKFSKSQKIEFLSNGAPEVGVLINNSKVTKNKLSPERYAQIKLQLKAIIPKLVAFQTGLDTYIDDDMFGKVGVVQKNASIYFSDDNHFLGSEIYYSQEGCAHLDESGEYMEQSGTYKNKTEAKKNKCFEEDVSWGGSSILNENFKEIDHSEYMEWTGH